jgi:hypothetical protein
MRGDLVYQLSEQVIDDPRARQLIRAAAEGNLEEKVRELGGDMASDVVKDITGNETAGALAKAAATNTLPDKLGELSGEVVDNAVGKLVSNEKTRSLLGPIIDHVKGQVSEKVMEKAAEMLGGGA